MDPAALPADPTAIRLEKIVSDISSLTLVVKATRAQAECPRRRRPSARIHSYYTRAAADLPWHGVAVRLRPHLERVQASRSVPAIAATPTPIGAWGDVDAAAAR